MKTFLGAFVLLASAGAQASDVIGIENLIISPHNADYQSHSVDWNQWHYTIPQNLSPKRDKTGASCALNQTGKIWYLANTDSPELTSRDCIIPAGIKLFFPVVENIIFTPPNIQQSCENVQALAQFEANPNYKIEIALNETSILLGEEFVIAPSDCFDLLGGLPSELNAPKYEPSSTSGIWVFLDSPPVGSHQLAIKADYIDPSSKTKKPMLNVIYRLTVR